jgi:hypothetical protein
MMPTKSAPFLNFSADAENLVAGTVDAVRLAAPQSYEIAIYEALRTPAITISSR